MKDTKSNIRQAQEKAKTGGKKKKPAKGAEAEPAKVLENCAIFIAKEYPDYQKACLNLLKDFQFDENNVIVGDYVNAVKDLFKENKK